MDGLWELTNALSCGAIGTKAHKILEKVAVGVVRESSKIFRAPIYIYGALRGHLCGSTAFLFLVMISTVVVGSGDSADCGVYDVCHCAAGKSTVKYAELRGRLTI